MPNSKVFRLAAAFWALSVAYLSLTPILPTPAGLIDDKIEHFAAYALLSLLAILGWHKVTANWRLAAAAALYGATMEVLQAFAPGRSPEWLDLLANTMGAALGLGITWILARVIADRAGTRT